MRRLLYVPIIHEDADLGRAGEPLAQSSLLLAGQKRWEGHLETLARFWEAVGAHLLSLDTHQLRVYQDGLPVEGEKALAVVEEAARRGSRNYRLLLQLLRRGAQLRKTEDPALLLEEHRLLRSSLEKGAGEASGTGGSDLQQRGHLAEARDRFIAGAVNSTLREGEVGVLFIGASHKVAPSLESDIAVEYLADPGLVRSYMEELLLGRDDQRLDRLAGALRSPKPSPDSSGLGLEAG